MTEMTLIYVTGHLRYLTGHLHWLQVSQTVQRHRTADQPHHLNECRTNNDVNCQCANNKGLITLNYHSVRL